MTQRGLSSPTLAISQVSSLFVLLYFSGDTVSTRPTKAVQFKRLSYCFIFFVANFHSASITHILSPYINFINVNRFLRNVGLNTQGYKKIYKFIVFLVSLILNID